MLNPFDEMPQVAWHRIAHLRRLSSYLMQIRKTSRIMRVCLHLQDDITKFTRLKLANGTGTPAKPPLPEGYATLAQTLHYLLVHMVKELDERLVTEQPPSFVHLQFSDCAQQRVSSCNMLLTDASCCSETRAAVRLRGGGPNDEPYLNKNQV